ncbi:LLM class F420-dependent oxidoreductase [Acidiferrimicrobium sp. IK]|uniref:LLM class F420-dependent oxidoreductase n=1 Tax=Acidiferrimicrobium sp. IK TaxID=2871700 RepID=UPI0021CB3EFE|nr:LLM class F420-dependent oxidoreductase [Acidiferrimicrobium sp. IK]MCU4183485.1 LLM class F420-dependent oxidoreductase [Acidiferrimicrobium sp. IK]
MNTPEDVPPDVLARHLEERGFDSLWIGEHSHIPVSRLTPYPSGGEMPDQYRRMMDPYASLLVAATATTDLLIGTGVALVLERDLLAMAKLVATVDRLSGGRLQFGVGVGWNREELANHRPFPWAQRYRALAEGIAALRTLWNDEESEYHGQYYDFDPVWSLPKPLQRPHPPIWCGTGGKLGTQHAVAWADGWMPMDVALGDVARKVSRFRQVAADAGRNQVPITIVAFGDPTPATLASYRDLGVERVVLGASRAGWDDPSTTLPFLDHYAPLVADLA